MRKFPLPSRLARTGCSVLALATVFVVGPSPAAAQSFLATGSPNNGAGTIITNGPGTTTISVTTPQTVVTWVPTDNATNNGAPIVFQNSGTTATFLGTGNFAVLNNIVAADLSRVISMNGTITAGPLGAQPASGSIYFYSPSGILLGGNSMINVGSLVLSASPIFVDVNDNFINGAGNQVIFGQALQSTAAITTNVGSQINATAGDAYVAMVAPRVQHGGSINVNGSAALVGAEAAVINFSPDGLFDIQVTTGTTDANGVASSGTITGAASTGAGDIHRAYMVAVPKNAALTMAITQGGSLGFDIAGAADVVGNTVVLSAGYNISGGFIESAPAAAGGAFKANLSITGANVSSALVAAASGNADIFSPLGQSSSFASDVTMHGVDQARVGASGFTTTVNIAGNLDLSTATSGTAPGQDVSSGLVEVYALQDATVTVTGSTNLNSNAFGGGSQDVGVAGGDAVAGDINVTAQTGGDVTLNGGLNATANGYGGYGAALGANGGSGTGGDIVVSANGVGSSIVLNSNVAITADGLGGAGAGLECFSCDGDGGTGNGGTVDVRALGGGSVNLIGENISISTNGVGGYAGNGNGGNAFGGSLTRIYADGVGSIVTFNGAPTVNSNATGGSSNGATGGTVEGGDIDIFAQNSGSVLFDSNLTLSADGTGGAGAIGGGDAFGGSVSIFSFATLQVDGALTATANATGGLLYSTDASGNPAGDAFGGFVDAYAQSGMMTLVGAVTLSTNAIGGEVGNFGDLAGDGTGGTTRLFANAGGTVDLQSTLNATAIGSGGGSDYYSSGIGGNGLGGAVRVQSTAANASVTVGGVAELDASGEGSDSSGGNGTGGTVWADSFGAATASLDFLSDVSLYAQGQGGDHNNSSGGNGQGGEALLQASAGSTLTVGGNAFVNTDAFGGYSYDFSDGVGGNATGGVSRIQAFAGTGTPGTIGIDGSAAISANGVGGASYSYVDGAGGDGTGGTAQLYASPGTVTIGTVQTASGASLTANGYGGDASNGIGGDGTGGELAEIAAFNGDITIEGYASVSASGFGGDGLYGGDGLGSGIPPTDTDPGVGGAHIFAQNGDIVIKGGASVFAVGTGGDGALDNNGYDGDLGGDGGNGTGGWASIHAANSNLGPSTITIAAGPLEGSGYATVDVSGTGGNGGDGSSGNAGGDGGNGGNGTGGTGSILAAAGNGTVTISNAAVYSIGQGGAGGDGGNGDGLPGGNGGDGGNGVGGSGTIGTASGNPQSLGVNNGFGDYGSITVDSSAFGGAGGDGNFGSTSGDGGNGGNAVGGGATLLVRGSRVDFNTATLTADATGGDGGFGDFETSADGDGGNATVGGDGGILVLVTERFQVPAHRGTLNGGSINGTAIATGGTGDSDGVGETLGGNLVVFRNSDGDLDSLDFLVQADSIGAGAVEDAISTVNGDVTIDGAFSFVTSGTLSLFADLGDFTADTFTLHAADFVPNTVDVTPDVAGTFFATSFDIVTGNNFLTTAHLDSIDTLTIVAPGAIFIGNVTGDDSIILEAQGGQVDIGNVLAGGGIDIDALTYINTGNITGSGVIDLDAGTSIGTGSILNNGNTSLNAGTSINVGAINSGSGSVSLVTNSSYISGDIIDAGSIYADSGSDIFLGDLTASGDIELIAVGDMLIGNAIAGETIDLDAGGYIDGGNMTAGDSVYAEAGDHVDLLAVSAGIVDPSSGYDADYNVGILAGTTIDTGDIEAFNSIGLGAAGNITTGNIDAGNIFLALSGGNMSFGTINAAGQTYLADDSMIALGGDPSDGDFDPAPILAATPVASGGSIALAGPVNAGSFQAAAGTTLTGTTIDSNGLLYATSGGNMTLGNLVADDDVRLTSGGNIVTGSIYSYDDVALVAAGSISTLDIFAYDDVSGDAGTTISTDDITGNSIELFADGDITTGDLLTQNFYSGQDAHALIPGTSITVESGGDVDVDTIDALDGVQVSAVGTISADTIDADDFVELFAGGNITAGTINAGSYIDIFSDTGLLDLDDLHAGTEIDLESDGSLQFGDATAADFNFEMGGSVDGGNIDAINNANGHAEGAIVLENITVTGPPIDDDFSIGFTSATSIAVENVDGFDRVGFATVGDLSTGTINAGSLFVALVGGDIVTGSITTDANGRVYMADESMCQGTCGDDDDDGDVEIETILAQSPAPTGGSITINGAVTTGSFEAAAGDNLVTRAITANSIEASAGETATIDGLWLAPSVSLVSGDINITANGFIDAGTSGSILLNAVSTEGPALIGDGLTGNGYALSNAEFGRISGGDITIAVGGSGGDADTLIGDLTITGPLAGSNVESSDGGVQFVTLNETGDGPDGTLRVVGDVVATGFGAENYLGFYIQNFELDAATGSIAITSSGTTLAGILELYASRIHVAEGGLLDQLAANPQFAGYREALNSPATVQRPEGVIRAASFDIEFGGQDITGPYTLFVQNMGTAAVPAGFLLNAASIGDGDGEGAGDLSPGSVDMAINGQIIAESGTSTGIAVRDMLVTEFGTTAFVAGSTINGCPLTGACTATSTPTPQINTPTSTDIPLSGSNGLGDGLFGNESEIADGEGGAGNDQSTPISPPNPLFDSRPLTQSGDIDDPVSGAGNPSLYGLPDDGTAVCDSGKDKACKVSEKGDGK